jgi:hypothetical protein
MPVLNVRGFARRAVRPLQPGAREIAFVELQPARRVLPLFGKPEAEHVDLLLELVRDTGH